jgi:hypothetical protein
MKSLTALANACKTDKGTTYRQGHGYTTLYEVLLEPYRDLSIRLLEVGLCIGGPELKEGGADRTVVDVPSIRMWHTFFPNAHIHGLDISDFAGFENEWFTFHRADCGDAAQLDAAVRTFKYPIDLIIDDGSHASFHQQLTFCKFLPLLKPRGLYIIEDLSWQPRQYEQTLPKVPRTDKLLARFIRNGSFPKAGNSLYDSFTSAAAQIANVFLFDEDYLYNARRFHNIRHGLDPDMPTYLEAGPVKRYLMRGYPRRVLEDSWLLLQSLIGYITPMRRPRTKLAVIQKK